MTLIARLVASNLPLLLGDLLVSTPEGAPVVLPTVGPFSPRAGEQCYQVSSMRQKVCIVGKNCVVAWSGSMIAARMVVRELRALAARDALREESIGSCFVEMGPDLQELCILGVLTEPRGDIAQHWTFQWGHAHRLPVSGMNELFVAGSGANHMTEDEHGNYRRLLELAFDAISSQVSESLKSEGALFALVLQNVLLTTEIMDGSTLEYLYGGGYEIATFGQGGYEKFDKALYAYALCDLELNTGDYRLHAPFRLSRSLYRGRTLTIVNADRPFEARPQLQAFVVPDIEETLSPAPFDQINAWDVFSDSLCTCLNVLVRVDDRIVTVVPIIASGTFSERSVAFRRNGDTISFHVDSTLIHNAMSAAAHAVSATRLRPSVA